MQYCFSVECQIQIAHDGVGHCVDHSHSQDIQNGQSGMMLCCQGFHCNSWTNLGFGGADHAVSPVSFPMEVS